jgi:hypothetical protein
VSAKSIIDTILETTIFQKECNKCHEKYGHFTTNAQAMADQGICPPCWRTMVTRIKDYLETGDPKKAKLDKDKKERKDYALRKRQAGQK